MLDLYHIFHRFYENHEGVLIIIGLFTTTQNTLEGFLSRSHQELTGGLSQLSSSPNTQSVRDGAGK